MKKGGGSRNAKALLNWKAEEEGSTTSRGIINKEKPSSVFHSLLSFTSLPPSFINYLLYSYQTRRKIDSYFIKESIILQKTNVWFHLHVLYVFVICVYMFVCLVTREHFLLAHAPLLSQRHSNFHVLRVTFKH